LQIHVRDYQGSFTSGKTGSDSKPDALRSTGNDDDLIFGFRAHIGLSGAFFKKIERPNLALAIYA